MSSLMQPMGLKDSEKQEVKDFWNFADRFVA